MLTIITALRITFVGATAKTYNLYLCTCTCTVYSETRVPHNAWMSSGTGYSLWWKVYLESGSLEEENWEDDLSRSRQFSNSLVHIIPGSKVTPVQRSLRAQYI